MSDGVNDELYLELVRLLQEDVADLKENDPEKYLELITYIREMHEELLEKLKETKKTRDQTQT